MVCEVPTSFQRHPNVETLYQPHLDTNLSTITSSHQNLRLFPDLVLVSGRFRFWIVLVTSFPTKPSGELNCFCNGSILEPQRLTPKISCFGRRRNTKKPMDFYKKKIQKNLNLTLMSELNGPLVGFVTHQRWQTSSIRVFLRPKILC